MSTEVSLKAEQLMSNPIVCGTITSLLVVS